MIQVDAAIASIIVVILLALIGMGIAWGKLHEKVKGNSSSIRQQDENFKLYCNQNREDHDKIFQKLDNMNDYLRNGRKS